VFETSKAKGGGGGVYAEGIDDSSAVNISLCIFDGCEATSGGGVCVKGINCLIVLSC
jgi:hypothetical protein